MALLGNRPCFYIEKRKTVFGVIRITKLRTIYSFVRSKRKRNIHVHVTNHITYRQTLKHENSLPGSFNKTQFIFAHKNAKIGNI